MRKFYIKNNFVVFEIFDEGGELDIFILDLVNNRFFNIDDIERKDQDKQLV